MWPSSTSRPGIDFSKLLVAKQKVLNPTALIPTSTRADATWFVETVLMQPQGALAVISSDFNEVAMPKQSTSPRV